MKNFLSGKKINPTIFHRTGISAASGIDSQTIHIKVLGKLPGSFFFLHRILSHIMERRGSKCLFCFFPGVKGFVECTFITLNL